MKRLTRDHHIYFLDPAAPPAIAIDSGEALLVETWDAFEVKGTLIRHLFGIGVLSRRPHSVGQHLGSGRTSMVRSLTALVLRRVLAWLVWSDEHAKDLEIVVLRHQLQVLRRQAGRPRIRWSDRLFLAAASHHLARETWRALYSVRSE
jgi:hypothetical protein